MDNNILSYFTKDIKDPLELCFYKQIKTKHIIKILYKDNLLYYRSYYNISNIINNIYKSSCINYRWNYEIYCDKLRNLKRLNYNKNNCVSAILVSDYISYIFTYKQYLIKTSFAYIILNRSVLITKIKYYKGYKYIYIKLKIYKSHIKNSNILILINNKYELQNINKMFIIY
jgi:hypothetical protein